MRILKDLDFRRIYQNHKCDLLKSLSQTKQNFVKVSVWHENKIPQPGSSKELMRPQALPQVVVENAEDAQ